MVPAPWQRIEVGPAANTGVVTVALVVIVWFALVGPPHPVAMEVTVLVPDQPAV